MSALEQKVKKGTFWVIVFFVASQIIRLAGNLIVTRLLSPDMFGIMAVIMVLIHGLIMFSDMGIWAFIVRSKNGLKDHYLNTAWSIQVIRGWLIFAITVLASIILFYLNKNNMELSGVYGHPILPTLIAIVGFTAVINAYASMAPAIVSREILRGKLEAIDLFAQILGVITMLVWAFYSPTIWSLVIAPIVSAFAKTITTNVVFHYRHKFEINKKAFTEIINFGKWIVVSSILTFISSQGDKLVFAYFLSAKDLGIYSIAFFLASALSMLIVSVSGKVFFPLFSHVGNNDRAKLKETYYKMRFNVDLVVGIAGGFLLATGLFWVDLLYDLRYQEAGWMLQILSVSLVGTAISTLGLYCLNSIGLTKISASTYFIRTMVLLIGLPIMFNFYGLTGAIWVVSVNVFFGLPLIFLELKKEKLLKWKNEIYIVVFFVIGYMLGSIFISLLK